MLRDLLRESSVAEALREEGKAEGKREMAQVMAQVALERRFGPLAADVLAAIQTVDEAALREVVAHAAGDSLEQMRARLGPG